MDKKSGVAPEQVQILTRTLGGLERDRLAKDDPVVTRFLRKNLPEEKTVYFISTFAGEVGNAGACDLTRFRYPVRFLGAKDASRQGDRTSASLNRIYVRSRNGIRPGPMRVEEYRIVGRPQVY
jgi:hypothetical protein